MRDRTIAFVGVIISALALVAGVVVFNVSQNKIANLKSGLKDAEAQIESNKETLAASGRAQVDSLTSRVDDQTQRADLQDKKLARMYNCLPELQDEIDGLNVSTEWQTMYGTPFLTSAYLENNQRVSRVCEVILQPTSAAASSD
jgi:uncharacterized protein HemX